MPAVVTKKATRAVKRRPTSATAIHAKTTDGEHHIVGIGNLRVAIASDGQYWTAQGLEIDYIAQGESLADARRQFEDGLASTIQQHLNMFGDIKRLLVLAPPEIWAEAMNPETVHNRFFQVTTHEVIKKAFPFFEGFDFLELSVA